MPMMFAALAILLSLWTGTDAPTAPPARPQTRLAYDVQKFWVYCIGTEVSVEMWDLAQMKVRRGSNVCQLYENTSMSSAMDWAKKNFPSGKCSCEP